MAYDELVKIDPEEISIWPLPNVWKFAPDPKDVGVNKKWYSSSFDDAKWAKVHSDVGTGWESQGFPGYTGYGWYRQSFTPPVELDRKHLYLRFGAVDEQAWIYINGEQVFEYTTQSTGKSIHIIWDKPFAFDTRDCLKPGDENSLAVRVHNQMAMGGVWKPVYLIAADRELDAPLIEALLVRNNDST